MEHHEEDEYNFQKHVEFYDYYMLKNKQHLVLHLLIIDILYYLIQFDLLKNLHTTHLFQQIKI